MNAVTTIPTRVFNAVQAGELLGVHASSIRKMWCNGELKCIQYGRKRVVSDAEISRYIAEHEQFDQTA
ncbi:helix-turn-helix domain-containing protein [Rhodococcus qingshengii]|uniref:helix-turn-helix domain-containing protein n=1 Tax=Rhodococcus qingshengii TaxID=334542 RepID=UPI0010A5DD34|nr:helix-turn-helix domain-containing protein [Rhodococcus qingshengii]THJ70693.1 helix-turn-helix domain-containing protein [Rhodococcus qingshengii]